MINSFTSRMCVALVLSVFLSLIGYGQVGINMEDKDYINSVTPAPNPAVTFKAATSIIFDKGGNLYIACRYGQVYRIKRGESQPTLILNIGEEVAGYGDHGLLGLTLDRDFLTNGRFYVYYVVDMYWYENFGKPGYLPNKSAETGATIGRVTRYTVDPNNNYKADPNSRKTLLGETLENGVPIVTPSHAGGGLATGVDGSILLGTGDASSFIEVDVGCNGTMTWFQEGINKKILKHDGVSGCNTYSTSRISENIGAYKSQALFSLCGKILRINPETGEGYPSNPFYKGSGSNLREAQNLIYALGFRQAFRLSIRPNTGDPNPANGNPGVLYVGDVGFSSWEELNVVSAPGQNFGWPYYEGHAKGRDGYWKTEVFKPAVHTKPRIQYRENKNTEVIQGDAVTSADKRPLEGNCIVGGVWHEGGGNYPKEFQNAYYFADYGSGWIAGARFGHDENPESNSIFKLAAKMTVTENSDRIVGMAFNPYDRNLYYVTLGEKSLVRQFAFTTNQPPTAVISKDKSFGSNPLVVNFSAKDSYDPEGGALTYEWNFNDGSSVNRTMTPPAKTFTATGAKTFNVTLKVTDSQGKSNTAQTVISVNNTPPVVESTSVDSYSQIALPQTISLNATASDAQTPADQLKYQWTVYLYHNDHRHAVSVINGRTGTVELSEGNCDGEASYWYGMVLDVTDAGGLTTTYTKYIYLSCGGQQQTISFDPISDKSPTAPAFRPPVSSSSGLPVTLFSVDGPATIENGQVKLTGGIGLVTIRATQHGNGQYRYAQPVERSFMVTNNAPSTPDTQAPTAPSGLAASNITATSLQLNWNASTDNVGVTGYDVYQNGNKINPNLVSSTTFAVSGLSPNTTYSFVVVARDAASNSSGNSNTATPKTLEAPVGNQAPVAPATFALSATINVAYNSGALAVFTDPNNDPLTYSLTGLPNGLSFNAGTRVITGTPTQSGTFNLTYSATDGSLKTDLAVTLTVATGGIVVTGNFEGYLDVVNCSSISGWVWDRDKPNTPITVEFLDGATAATAVPIGSTLADIFRQDLKNANKGNGAHGYSFTVPERVKDNQSHTIWGRVQGSTFILTWSPKNITCAGTGTPTNQPPVAPSVSNLTATINSAYTSAALPVFTDPNNDALTYALSGLPNGLSFNAGSRVISGTPTQTGPFNLTYSATDGKSSPVTVTITLTVNEGSGTPPVNQPPVAPTVSNLTATVNTAYTSAALPVFTDPNSDALTYALSGLPNGLSFNTGSRVISGTPTQQGSFNLTYSATDGKSEPVTVALTLTVNPATSTPPLPAANFDGYLTQEVNCNTLSGWAYDRTSVNRHVTVEFFDGPSIAGGTPIGSIVASAFRQHLKDAGKGNGEHWYDFPIPESLKDGQNHTIWARVQGSEFILKWAPKTINCAGSGTPPVNQPPVAPTVSNLTATVNTAYTSAALPVFTDPNNDALTYALSGLPNGLSFSTGSRVISGTPTQTGSFNLTYSATDGKSDPVLVNLTLTINPSTPTNQPPVAPTVSNLTATVNTAYSSAALPVFTDPNNDALTYALSGLPNGLSFNTGSRVISGTPTQQGSFNLTYSATDGKSEPVTVALTLTVNPATSTPPLPAANFDGYLTQEVNCNTLSGWAYDRTRPNAALTIEFFDGPSIAAGTPIGSILADDFRQHLKDAGKGNGEHWYDFPIPETLKDGQNHTIWARVQGSEFILKWAPKTINCAGSGTPPVNQPPVAPTISNLTATVNTAYSSAALPVFTDPNNDALTYALSGLPNGLSFSTGSRVISGTPTQTGSFNLTYSATDGKSDPVLVNLTLTVSESNNPPTSGSSGPGNYEGYLDVVNCSSIQGWIWNRDKPNTHITVEFLDGNTVVGSTDANIFRQDLKNANKGNGEHGYSFQVPNSLKDGKAHSISGRVPNSTFVLKWSPKTLTCPAGSRQGASESPEISLELNVSPNPSRGPVEVTYRVGANQRASLQIVDLMGRSVWQKSVIGTGRTERETIDLRNSGADLYLIQLQTARQLVFKRLLINR
ncbi:putative Ig domain-containing protein [Larkinella sp. VNQ87]|uniref:putative Ig domain-containing protein n=1 Tax=Larkinella sp. VNQ87 TaxID=3400921 RepID=UPI003BFF6797